MTGWIVATLACSGDPIDGDGDGFIGGEDCNDADAAIHPDAPDQPGDGIDRNCDGWDGDVVEIGATAIHSPVPDEFLEFGHAMVASDVDGDGVDELLVGSQDTKENLEFDGGQAWLLAGPTLEPLQGWVGEDASFGEARGDALGAQVATGALLSGPPAIVLFSLEAVYVLPTDPFPETQLDPRVVTLPQDGAIVVGPHFAMGTLIEGGVADLVLTCIDGVPLEDVPQVRVLAGPLALGDTPVDSDVVIATVGYGSDLAAPDLDGDGFDDLAIGMSEVDEVAGRIAVFPGPLAIGSLEASDAAITWFGEEAGDWLGEKAIDAGDLDADGLADLAATSMGWPGHTRRGRVYVVDLDTPDLATADVVLDGEAADGHDFGGALAAGDYDGDGQGDLAIGAPSLYSSPERPGRVYLYIGPLVGPIAALDADQIWVGENGGDTVGASLAFADLDGDGTDEIVASASRNDDDGPDAGKLYLLQGQPP